MNIKLLSQIIENLPDDFIVEFEDVDGHVYSVSDNIVLKLSEKRLVFKEV